ncbi:hypothetical protein GCK72_001703 [Caenorhabditis remanei]|uniref:WW domain-containing protein n=1 Tax=Caenorhabditis remanei TaxID=31234 RepID=A0A6A5HT20_CAERE|nr:hypothetical protein GCK72_001703 [Caenorhabditis remanei]KAF1769886.1 hypothetical protein GCK72_001703 [Caenorhabditis remanei]
MAERPSISSSPEETRRIGTRLHTFREWREVRSRSWNGKIYYYNEITEESTWYKPIEWLRFEARQAQIERERRVSSFIPKW